jgi:hypothetical protein
MELEDAEGTPRSVDRFIEPVGAVVDGAFHPLSESI